MRKYIKLPRVLAIFVLIGISSVVYLKFFRLPNIQGFPGTWATYRNKQYDYEFSYPRGWKINDVTKQFYKKDSGLIQRLVIKTPYSDSHYSGGDFGETIWNRGIELNFVVDTLWSSLDQIEKEKSSQQRTSLIRTTYSGKEYLVEEWSDFGDHYKALYTIGKLPTKAQPVTFIITFTAGDDEGILPKLVEQFAYGLKF